MYARIQTDREGWVQQAYLSDGPAETAHAFGGQECLPDEVHAVTGAGRVAWFDPVQRHLCIPQDVARCYRRLRTVQQVVTSADIAQIRAAASGCLDLPAGVPLGSPTPVSQARPLPGPLDSGLADLTIRPGRLEDADQVADVLVGRGLWQNRDEAWLMAAWHLEHADAWPLVWEWRGQPLQLEVLHWDQPEPKTIRSGYTVHLTQERPHWFWREAERPVWAALQAAGITRMVTGIRGDREDWVDVLKREYGAQETGRVAGDIQENSRIFLEYVISPAPFTGWPARRTLGADWQWQTGNILIREGTEADLVDLPAVLEQSWGSKHPGLPRQIRLLREQWELDRGTLLLGYEAGTLTEARIYRMRRPDMANHTTLTRLRDMEQNQGQRWFQWGMYEWLVAAGYRTESSFVTDEIFNHPIAQKSFAFRGVQAYMRHAHYRIPMVEYRVDLPRSLALIRDTQGRWRPEAGAPGPADSFPQERVLL